MIRQDVLQKAAVLFAERGFASTTLSDIAEAVGLSRPALYYYFQNKDEVLTALVEEATTYPVAILEKHRKNKQVPPAERLRGAMRELVSWIVRSPVIIRVLESNESKLPAAVSAEHHQAKRRVLKAFVDMITDGIQAGDFRPVEPRLAAFALIGMGNWTAWWYTPEGERTPDEVAAQFAEMAVHSLQWNGGKIAEGSGVEHALALIKADVAQLERAIALERGGEKKSPKN